MAVSLNDVIIQVYTYTNKSFLVNETKLAVKNATTKMHTVGMVQGVSAAMYYDRDLLTSIVPVTASADMRYSLDLSSGVTYPRFRKEFSISQYNSSRTGREMQFEQLAADNLFDQAYKLEKTNYFTRIGTALNINASIALDNIQLLYYAYPNITDTGYSSWIADMNIDAIAVEAARLVFAMTGMMEEAAAFKLLSDSFVQDIMGTGITA